MEKEIRELLDDFSVPKNRKGYEYLVEAIGIVAKDPEKTEHLSREIYQPIAAKYSTTAASVQQAIGRAIKSSWASGDPDLLARYFGYIVYDAYDRPTNYEFIAHLADKIGLMMSCRGEWP